MADGLGEITAKNQDCSVVDNNLGMYGKHGIVRSFIDLIYSMVFRILWDKERERGERRTCLFSGPQAA